jgi:putative aldouronate transport system permease protein
MSTPKKGKYFTILNFFFMSLVVFLTLYPMVYLTAVSFSSARAVMNMKVTFFPVEFSVEAYRLVLQDAQFWQGYLNTFIYTIGGTLIAMITTVLAAYPLSKSWLRGNKLILRLFVFTMFFNGGLIPNFLWIKSLGLINTIWAIVLPLSLNPFFMIIMKTFLQTIPESLEEAAEIDGMNPMQILLGVVLPLSKPILATVSLFYAVFFWNDWFRPLIFLNEIQKHPVTLFLRNMVIGHTLAAQQGEVSEASEMVGEMLKSASIVLVSFPILCVYPFVQKYFVKGMLIGSVKG